MTNQGLSNEIEENKFNSSKTKRKAKHKLFDTLHHNYRPYPKDKTIYEVFQERVKDTPDKVALSFKGESLTYKEVNEKANQLARYIRSQYRILENELLEPDKLVAIFVSRSANMIVSIIGVLKSGAAYVPIDINSPEQRISYIMEDTQCSLIVTESSFVNKLDHCLKSFRINGSSNDKLNVNMILLDDNQYMKEPSDNLKSYSKSTDLAYVIYTSGTTGKPKGVMIEHHSVLNLCSSRRKDYGIDESSVVLQYSPIAFDCSVCEIFSALLNGAKLAVIDDITKRDSNLLIDYFLTEKISVATFLPSLLSQLALTDLPKFPNLKTIIAAGEACTSNVISKWQEVCNLIIGYGPTETTVCSTLNPYIENDAPNIVGTAIPNTTIYLLNENLQQVNEGEVGEICVSGVSLARGYLNKPESTAQNFISNPFVTELDKRNGYSHIYRTGDLARWLDDGRLEFIGRNDSQIKIRGHRVGLDEIQAELSTCPSVMQVFVQARERKIINSDLLASELQSDASMNYLVVYYVSDSEIPAETFVNHLSNKLPEYMIPSYYIKLNSFPQTVNGKIDSKALPEPTVDAHLDDYVAPSNDLEKLICEIWQSILGLETVGIKSNFFNIGGDSLLVISLIAFINNKLDVKLTTSMINNNPTVCGQAKLVKQQLELQSKDNLDKCLGLITTFRSQGIHTPLIFIHPSLTGSAIYSDMVNWLDADQPFYGIESYNLSHLDNPETDMVKLANLYINEIKQVLPQGPYRLGGYSAGGNIAYEVAKQLLDSSDIVETVYLIDSVQPNTNRKSQITDADAKDFLEYFGFNPADERLLQLAKIELKLLFGFKPTSRLQTKVVLLKATNIFSSMDGLPEKHVARYFFQPGEEYSSWDRFTDEVHKHEIDADHHSILDHENLQKVTNIIQNDIKSIKIDRRGVNSFSN
jgi:amino acid adenylation domain-containing protein